MAQRENGEMVMSLPDKSLQGTLLAQQQLLQKLSCELDVEREAASTAASEALSMILRLQGEKAAVKLEAEQYKRLAEEKICHTEEALSLFEDLICQKEMEIAALDYQVQAYRYRLLSMGCADPGVGEIKFPENLLQRRETLGGDANVQNLTRRNSFPVLLPHKYTNHRKVSSDKEKCLSSDAEMITKIVEGQGIIDEQNLDLDKKIGTSAVWDMNSYWKEIKKLDERVREIAGPNHENDKGESKFSNDISYHPTEGSIKNEPGQIKKSKYGRENDNDGDSGPSSSFHDVFEVPETHGNKKDSVQLEKEHMNIILGEQRLQQQSVLLQKAEKSSGKEKNDWEKNVQLSTHSENRCRPSDVIASQSNTTVVHPARCKNELSRMSEMVKVENKSDRLETLIKREEELKLLNEIRKQLRSIESAVLSLKTENTNAEDDTSWLSLQKAMQFFWV